MFAVIQLTNIFLQSKEVYITPVSKGIYNCIKLMTNGQVL